MINYVVGFAFDESKENVLLMRKNRPDWQKGYLNGLGGHIEINEYPLHAMRREAYEEAGIDVSWKYRAFIYKPNIFNLYVFYAYSDEIFNFQQKEDEILNIYNTLKIYKEKMIHNLYFMIPYGIMGTPVKNMTLQY